MKIDSAMVTYQTKITEIYSTKRIEHYASSALTSMRDVMAGKRSLMILTMTKIDMSTSKLVTTVATGRVKNTQEDVVAATAKVNVATNSILIVQVHKITITATMRKTRTVRIDQEEKSVIFHQINRAVIQVIKGITEVGDKTSTITLKEIIQKTRFSSNPSS